MSGFHKTELSVTDDRKFVESLPAVLAESVRQQSSRVVFTSLDRDGEVVNSLTAGQLDERCRELAGRLRTFASRGDRVLVPSMQGGSFQVAFLACLYAEMVAVPVPALRVGSLRNPDHRSSERLGRLLAVCGDCQPVAIIVPAEQHQELAALAERVPQLRQIRFVSVGRARTPAPPVSVPERVDRDSLAFLQYTSGSTSTPRGVMISNGAMLANQRQIKDLFDVQPDWTLVNWLPTFHDMGLCAGLLQPIYSSMRGVLMDPETFMLSPERWLAAMSNVPDVSTAAPDFAYAYAAARVPASVRATLDLSGWRVALTGAEPVKPGTVRRFSETFASCGFNSNAFSPAFGLAESTLLVTVSSGQRPPTIRRFGRAALQQGHAVSGPQGEWQELVGVGHPPKDTEIRIVAATDGAALPANAVGEIWVRSPSNGLGYWGQPKLSAETFHCHAPQAESAVAGGGWLRTGDLGFVDESDELFITGRSKEMIIIRGANYFPGDFEHLAQTAHPLLQKGLCAAFADRAHPERVVIVVETDRAAQRAELATAAAQGLRAVTAQLPVQTELLLIPVGMLPRTTSGKVRRLECSARHLDGTLRVLWSSNDAELPQPAEPISGRDGAGSRSG